MRAAIIALCCRLSFAVPWLLLTTHYAGAQSAATPSQPAPAPIFTYAPTPAPTLPAGKSFAYGGTLRAYEFYRTNGTQNATNPNRQAFNAGAALHLEYHLDDSHVYVATTYQGAYPFGANGQQPQLNSNVDNTLPGFPLTTFDEALVGYSNGYVQAKIGNQIINTPWANASDTRIKPVAFQGASIAVNFAPGWTAIFDDMIRFESRTSSTFGRYTLLTAPVAGASNALTPASAQIDTGGFVMGGLAYQWRNRFELAAFDYDFESLANMLYVQGQFNAAPQSKANPFVGVQFANETSAGPAFLGTIDNQTAGLQLGATVAKNLVLQASGDYAPWRSATVALSKCSAATGASTGYFLPGGGTPDCVATGPGTATIYYGGIASPYTDSYATDVLYTTSISQGMADRRSAGVSEKLGATYQPFDKRLRLIVSEAWYNYTNGAGANLTREFNADATYFLNRVRPGPYHGLSLRYRYADRTQPTLPFDFKYNRAQLEYDF